MCSDGLKYFGGVEILGRMHIEAHSKYQGHQASTNDYNLACEAGPGQMDQGNIEKDAHPSSGPSSGTHLEHQCLLLDHGDVLGVSYF